MYEPWLDANTKQTAFPVHV